MAAGKMDKREDQAPGMVSNRARICVAVGVLRLDEALELVRQESSLADVIEIRLDCLKEKTVEPFFSATEVALLFTNRPEWEGGDYRGPEAERIELLARAADLGAAYIDCELRAPEDSRQRLKEKGAETGTKVIFSYHDFNSTPSEEILQNTLVTMQEQGADIGKIVTTAHDYLDVLRVLELQESAAERGFPLISFCMGRVGMISRLATLELGGYMTYCSTATGGKTAPGQISAAELVGILGRFF